MLAVLGAGGAVGSSVPPEAPSTAAAAPGRRGSFAGLAEGTAGLHAPLTGVLVFRPAEAIYLEGMVGPEVEPLF